MSKTNSNETAREKRRRDLRKGVYIVPSLLTTANIFCGFYSVIESLRGFQQVANQADHIKNQLDPAIIAQSTYHFNIAALCIGWSVLFDFLDGRIARMANATSEFGVELDSIADVLSFGIAPAVLAFSWGYSPSVELQKLAWAVSFMFLVCGALRLARFNVQSRKPVVEEEVTPLKPVKKYFVGMPIPAGASLIAAIVHFSPMPLILRRSQINLFDFSFDASLYTFFLLILMAVLALLMVSTIRYNSFKSSGGPAQPARRNTSQMVILIAILMFIIYQWSQFALLGIATCYAAMGPLGKLISFIRPHQPPSITPDAPEVGLHQQ